MRYLSLVILFTTVLGFAENLPTFQKTVLPNYSIHYPKTKAGEGTCSGICIAGAGIAAAKIVDEEKSVDEVTALMTYNAFSGKMPADLPKRVKLADGKVAPLMSEKALSEIASSIQNYYMPNKSSALIAPTNKSVLDLFFQFAKDNKEKFLTTEAQLANSVADSGVAASEQDRIQPFIAMKWKPVKGQPYGHAILFKRDKDKKLTVFDPTDADRAFRAVTFKVVDGLLTASYEMKDHTGSMVTVHWDQLAPASVLSSMVKVTQGHDRDLIIPLPKDELKPHESKFRARPYAVHLP